MHSDLDHNIIRAIVEAAIIVRLDFDGRWELGAG